MAAPETEGQLAELLRQARGPFEVVGGGTRTIGGPVQAEVLDTAHFTGIRLYEPGALTLVAGAGTALDEVEAVLAASGQRLPFEVPDMRRLSRREGRSTIGGVVAANASGPRRVQAGACRDSLIGVRFVDGTGMTVKNGGRVMKNVTGYDLVKLMAGSHGTLGVLTEVGFKVLPVPDAAATLELAGLADAEAIAAMASALGSPFEVTGAAHWPGRGTWLRIEGFTDSVAYRAGRLAARLAPFGAARLLDREETRTLWQDIRDLAPFHDRDGDVWRLSVRPTEAAGLAGRIGAEAVLYDWGGGLIWALLPEGTDLRARTGAFAGHATLVRASDETRRQLPAFHPEPAPLAAIATGLRARFDPRGILNPGRMA